MKVTTVGLDLAKNIFQVHGVNEHGRAVIRKQLTRSKVKEFFANLPPCRVGMEACGSSHYWARELMKFGHDVKLISPQFVKPYVKGNKNDRNDAEGICEAVARPNMRFVAVKTVAQQDLQALHRVRSRLFAERTALGNQIRGLLGEYGIVIAQSLTQLRRALPIIMEDAENGLTGAAREVFAELYAELVALDVRIKQNEQRIGRAFKAEPMCQKIAAIPGVGPLTATAMIAAVGDGQGFRHGREMAAWLGLVPRQHSSGGKAVLLGISKRGDRYLRMLLIHGARAVLQVADKKPDARHRWAAGLKARRGPNIAAVALANKTARTIWAVLTGDGYRAPA